MKHIDSRNEYFLGFQQVTLMHIGHIVSFTK